jgi:hypothetical protein
MCAWIRRIGLRCRGDLPSWRFYSVNKDGRAVFFITNTTCYDEHWLLIVTLAIRLLLVSPDICLEIRRWRSRTINDVASHTLQRGAGDLRLASPLPLHSPMYGIRTKICRGSYRTGFSFPDESQYSGRSGSSFASKYRKPRLSSYVGLRLVICAIADDLE